MSNRGRAVLILFLASLAGSSCGGPPPNPTGGETTRTVALEADRSDVARAAYFAAEVARLREVARRERELSAAYARRTPPVGTTKDWNVTLKARVDARVAALERTAARLQTFADFHTAEAAKEMGR